MTHHTTPIQNEIRFATLPGVEVRIADAKRAQAFVNYLDAHLHWMLTAMEKEEVRSALSPDEINGMTALQADISRAKQAVRPEIPLLAA